MVDHYKSIECIEVNTEQILAKIDALFSGDEIPWENLISDLTDSAAYMKGKKSGLSPARKSPTSLGYRWRYVSSHAQCCEKILLFFRQVYRKPLE